MLLHPRGRKRGRISRERQAWLRDAFPRYAIPSAESRAEILERLGVFAPQARLWFEIGFGHGEFLVAMARRYPEDCFLGVDVYLDGLASLIKQLEWLRLQREEKIGAVRIVPESAWQVLTRQVPENSLDRVVINFPDPWPKKRHHKRRLVQPLLLDLLARKMRVEATLHVVTDWSEYAWQILGTLDQHPDFSNSAGAGHFAEPPEQWVQTRFERRGRSAGREIFHLDYTACREP